MCTHTSMYIHWLNSGYASGSCCYLCWSAHCCHMPRSIPKYFPFNYLCMSDFFIPLCVCVEGLLSLSHTLNQNLFSVPSSISSPIHWSCIYHSVPWNPGLYVAWSVPEGSKHGPYSQVWENRHWTNKRRNTSIITHGGDAGEVGWRVGLGPIGLGDRGDAALRKCCLNWALEDRKELNRWKSETKCLRQRESKYKTLRCKKGQQGKNWTQW